MERRLFLLDRLTLEERNSFVSELTNRFLQAIQFKFPEALGFRLTRDREPESWRISRGLFWGLHFKVSPKDGSTDSLVVSINSYFPVVNRGTNLVDRYVEEVEKLPQGARILLYHLAIPVLLFPLLAILPFWVAYRLALVLFTSNARRVVRELENLFQAMQANWAERVTLRGMPPPTAVLLLATLMAAGAAFACFGLADWLGLGQNWERALSALGFIFSLAGGFFLIALVLAGLGFEVKL